MPFISMRMHFRAAASHVLEESCSTSIMKPSSQPFWVMNWDMSTHVIRRNRCPKAPSLRFLSAASPCWPEWQVVVVLPVDHPLVTPETIKAIAAPAAPAVLPVHGGRRGHPVALAREVAEGIASGAISGPTLHHVVAGLGWVEVAVDDPGVHANCNTPGALAAALKALG